MLIGSLDSAFVTPTRLQTSRDRVRMPEWARGDPFLQNFWTDRFCGPPSLLLNRMWSCLRVNRPEHDSDHSSVSSAEVKMWRGQGRPCYVPCPERIYRHEQRPFVINVIFSVIYSLALRNYLRRIQVCPV